MRKGVKYIICLNILQKIEQLINTNIIKYEPKYLVKILDVKKIDRKKCIKIELIHNGTIDVSNFNESKNIINSQFNEEPM
jgi:hypothetical protein